GLRPLKGLAGSLRSTEPSMPPRSTGRFARASCAGDLGRNPSLGLYPGSSWVPTLRGGRIVGPSARRALWGAHCGGGCTPTATQRLAQRHERLEARQPVLREPVARGIQSALRFQQREKVAGSPLIAQLRPLKGAFALGHAALLEFAHRVEVL